jgi:hypothetical protein
MSNGIQIRGIIDLQSHIGWTLERILNIRISNAMDEPLYVAEPTYYPNLKRLFFNPDKRIGWPKLYKKIAGLKPSDSEYKYFWKMHNTIREPLHALHEIYIPQPLRDVLDACINKSTKNNLPHLFSYQSPAGKSVTFRQEDIKAYLKDASEFFKEKALYGRDIHPNQIKTFFEIAYHHAGLCPEQRYLISGDIQTAYIVSLWYFRTSISNLHGNFTAAYNQVESRIWRDAEEIASDYNLDIVWPDNILYENPEAIGQAYDRANYSLGSWRCARLDIAKKTVEILKNDYVLTVGDRMDKPKNHNVRWSRFFDRKLTEIKV